MFWLKSFTSLLAVLTTLIVADDPCRFEHSKGIIDLTSLARTDGKAAYPDKTESAGANYLYSYNPCKPFSEVGDCLDVAVYQSSLLLCSHLIITKLHLFQVNLLTALPDSLYLITDMKKLNIQNNNFDAKEKAWIEGIFRVTNTTVVV
ncbi:unnamed protein product [Adineta steineri]|uniref:Uncharacterized protein n=1 Tax=Adineta steineri TaxID=433720 RepID=A0A814G8U8_9BILA|nr:unnamed protein product [Adineta steineri]